MLIVVVYDICTKDSDGRKRLNSVKTVCKNYGVSVQDSVFECRHRGRLKLYNRISPLRNNYSVITVEVGFRYLSTY